MVLATEKFLDAAQPYFPDFVFGLCEFQESLVGIACLQLMDSGGLLDKEYLFLVKPTSVTPRKITKTIWFC